MFTVIYVLVYHITVQGILLMYDITSPATFIDIDRWIGAIREVSKSLCLCVVYMYRFMQLFVCMCACIQYYVNLQSRFWINEGWITEGLLYNVNITLQYIGTHKTYGYLYLKMDCVF